MGGRKGAHSKIHWLTPFLFKIHWLTPFSFLADPFSFFDPFFPFSFWVGYWTGVATADHPLGPWKKDPRGRIFRGGHLAVFDHSDNRKWFCYRGESHDAAHGKLCVAPINLEQP
ncbi:MAG: hypothetical protein K9M45_13245 [Kiritimatiellales bacterium]|nr:hypothetical protein [Kiritimatiellales bacterium]